MTKTFYLFIATIFVFFVSICFFIYGLFDPGNKFIDFHIEKEDEIKDETTQPPTQPPQMVAVECPPGVILFTICCALLFVLILSFFAMDYTYSYSLVRYPTDPMTSFLKGTHSFVKNYIKPFFPLIAIALIALSSIIIHGKNTLHAASVILLTATLFIYFAIIHHN